MPDTELSMRDHAVAHARNGFRVFKLIVNGKTPLSAGFPETATNDPAKVHEMWTAPLSGDALHNNIGILTGGDFFVVDVDVKDGKKGDDTLDALLDQGLDTDTRTARSPTGSLHLYYELPDGRDARNTVQKLGPGVDTRGHHGFVVAPGSTIDGEPYEWLYEQEMKIVPDWLLDRCEKVDRPIVDAEFLGDVDLEANIVRAIRYLEREAPEAIEHAGGDEQTLKIANRVMDFGVSEHEAFHLMLGHWNDDKALPPWAPDNLQRKVENAARYRQEPIGRSSASADFYPVDLQTTSAPATWPSATAFNEFVPADLPKRRWIVKDFLVRSFVAGVVSPGGMGKTQFIANLLLAIAADDDTPIGMPVLEQTTCWYWNQEDDNDELKRRFAAAMQHHKITFARLGNRIRLDSGVEKPLILVKRTADGRIVENKVAVDQVIATIKANGIGVFTFDPLVEFHEAEENDNVQMRVVMATARRIAVEGECAVLVVAHTRKPPGASAEGFAGDMDALRGAGAQANVMRLMHTLFGMTVKDAKAHGVQPDQRHLYVRLDTAKSNLSLINGKPKWMRRVSVAIGGEGGETVGVLEPANLVSKGVEMDVFHIVAKAIASGKVGLKRGAWVGLSEVAAAMDESEIAAFGDDNSNRARVVGRCAKNLGITLAGVDGKPVEAETLTDFGGLRIVKKAGRAGIQFNLKAQ